MIKQPNLAEIEHILQELNQIFATYPSIDQAVLFGSRARGDHKRTSDIDLCIYGNPLSKRDKYDILNDIEEIDTFYSFDIIFFDELDNEPIKESVLKDMHIVYRREQCEW